MIVTYHYISHGQLGSLCPKKLMFCKKVHSITRCYNFDKQNDKHYKQCFT